MAKPEQFTAQQMIDALMATGGMVTQAAKKLHCASNTVRRYIEKYPTVAAAVDESRERMGDDIELILYEEAVKKRNTAVMIFLAKTKFKSRGYVERVENLNIDLSPELWARFEKLAAQAETPAHKLFEDMMNAIATEFAESGEKGRSSDAG